MRIGLAPRAVREAEACARWWARTGGTPVSFSTTSCAPLSSSAAQPPRWECLRLATGSRAPADVAALLPGSRFHVYYRLAVRDLVRVLAIWSAFARPCAAHLDDAPATPGVEPGHPSFARGRRCRASPPPPMAALPAIPRRPDHTAADTSFRPRLVSCIAASARCTRSRE
jgi:hypothetical protein